jgi:hypothetical protein
MSFGMRNPNIVSLIYSHGWVDAAFPGDWLCGKADLSEDMKNSAWRMGIR